MKLDWLINRSFAHRGLQGGLQGSLSGHVENSLSAFRAAVAGGYGIELDVQLSRDGRAMVYHDPILDRLTSETGPLIARKATELSALSLSDGPDSIPTLRQVFEEIDGQAPILVEIKGDQGQFDPLANAVWHELETYQGPVAVMSIYQEFIIWFRQNSPSVTCGFMATDIPQGDYPSIIFSCRHHIDIMRDLTVDFLAYDIQSLPNEVTEYCRKNNIPVLTGPIVNEAQEAQARKYADNFIFDFYSALDKGTIHP